MRQALVDPSDSTILAPVRGPLDDLLSLRCQGNDVVLKLNLKTLDDPLSQLDLGTVIADLKELHLEGRFILDFAAVTSICDDQITDLWNIIRDEGRTSRFSLINVSDDVASKLDGVEYSVRMPTLDANQFSLNTVENFDDLNRADQIYAALDEGLQERQKSRTTDWAVLNAPRGSVFQLQQYDDRTIITFNAPKLTDDALKEALRSCENSGKLLIDLTQVSALDNEAIGSMIALSSRGVELALCGAQKPGVQSKVTDQKLAILFPIFGTLEEAKAA